jgi:hypothetical protein
MKIQPILAMFSQTATVLPNDKIVSFRDPHAIGNRALYLLISSRTDSYFQRAIKQFEPFGEKALELLQEQCAHISREDQSYFHERLVGLKIRENESASSLIKRFTYAKTTAEAASNTYSDNQLVDFVLAGLRSSKQDIYCTALQLYHLEHLQGTDLTLREIEQNFFQIDKGIERDKRQLRTEHAMVAGGTHRGIPRGGCFGHRGRGRGRGSVGRHPQTASAHAAQQSSVTCYKCGEKGHITTSCPTNNSGISQSSSASGTGQSGQRARTAPPAHKHAAAAQEGESSATTSTRSNFGSSSRNAMVCMACTVCLEQAMSARHIVNYNLNPTLHQPGQQPVPVLDMDFDSSQFLNIDRFVTFALPVTAGQPNNGKSHCPPDYPR